MSASLSDNVASQEQQGNSVYAALARTAARSAALYFSRPVRLFRPAKVSGWQSLRGHALKNGQELNPQYITSLLQKQGWAVVPKHFLPPMLANAALGTVLWTSYAEASQLLEDNFDMHPTTVSALSGAVAGGVQSLAAAPVENVRLVIEGGTGRGWSHAWKEVFRNTAARAPIKQEANVKDARDVRAWMRDVKGMAGRGWDGWGWGCAKDMLGFAAFFAIFDVTRRFAQVNKTVAEDVTLVASSFLKEPLESANRHFPRVVHGVTLVGGGVVAGVCYEMLGRPWDAARKAIQVDRTVHPDTPSPLRAVTSKFREEGFPTFFRDVNAATTEIEPRVGVSRWTYNAARTVARVGPWGVGFLVWEAFGPGIS